MSITLMALRDFFTALMLAAIFLEGNRFVCIFMMKQWLKQWKYLLPLFLFLNNLITSINSRHDKLSFQHNKRKRLERRLIT